jgi:electron transfer flavoprotein beta subunit
MNIIVCIKRAPDTAEVPIEISDNQKSIKEEKLTFDINEPDKYALEEAILIKEKFGGTVTIVTIGNEASEDILRMGLAKGADSAIRIWDDQIEGSDPYVVAKILSQAVKGEEYDLIMAGCIAYDDGYSIVGPALAEVLGIPHAAIVTNIEIKDSLVKVQRELEGGLLELLEIKLPALLAIQTGINEPRYASMIGIRKAAQKPIKVMGINDIGLNENEVGEKGSKLKIEKIYIPVIEKKAQILEGSPEEVSQKLADTLSQKGVL